MEILRRLVEDYNDWRFRESDNIKEERQVERALFDAWFNLGGKSGYEVELFQISRLLQAQAAHQRFYDPQNKIYQRLAPEVLLAYALLHSPEIINQTVVWFDTEGKKAEESMLYIYEHDFSWMQLEMDLSKTDTKDTKKTPGKLIKDRLNERKKSFQYLTRQFLASCAASAYLQHRFL